MILSRTTPTQLLQIWQPRWKDRRVLLAKYKIGTHNTVTFKSKSLPGEYYISGAKATKFPVESNGKLACYAVPLDELEPLEREGDKIIAKAPIEPKTATEEPQTLFNMPLPVLKTKVIRNLNHDSLGF